MPPGQHSRLAAAPAKTSNPDKLQGIVYSSEGKRVGLVIDQILDIVHESIKVKSDASRPGVLYTAVIQGRVTELLDMPALLQAFERNRVVQTQQQERVEV